MLDKENFKDELRKILDGNNIGTMATVRNDKPMSRYMYFYNDGLTLYTYTRKGTYKVEDIEKNPHTHILLGYEERDGMGERYVEIEGKASLPEDVTPDIDEVLAKAGQLYKKLKGENDMQAIRIDIDEARIMNDGRNAPAPVEL